MTDSHTESPEAFDRLLEHVGSEIGFEADFYNDAYLDRRITARMRRVGADTYGEYLRELRGDGAEAAALLDSLSINVTGFFRNPEVWESVRSVLGRLTEQRRRVRVWSAPCADGREPYSIAMLALEDDRIDERGITILGTDISEDALAAARRGVYETSQTTDIGEELEPLEDCERYVERDDGRFRVRDRVRDLVTFERHDLIRGEPKSEFDLVVCRNFLIYIDTEYKIPIFETVEGSLRDRGYLAIGMTETLPHECRDAFEPVDKRNRVYRTT